MKNRTEKKTGAPPRDCQLSFRFSVARATGLRSSEYGNLFFPLGSNIPERMSSILSIVGVASFCCSSRRRGVVERGSCCVHPRCSVNSVFCTNISLSLLRWFSIACLIVVLYVCTRDTAIYPYTFVSTVAGRGLRQHNTLLSLFHLAAPVCE